MIKNGNQSFNFEKKIYIADTYSVVGPKENSGPLSSYFHKYFSDDLCGKTSYENAEQFMCTTAAEELLMKNNSVKPDIYIGGDLLNQIITTSFTARKLNVPYWGIYSACSSFGEAASVASMCVEAGMKSAVITASSHFSTAERQYRAPLELGNQRPAWAQWTVTGAGAALISDTDVNKNGVLIKGITIGKVVDLGVTDTDNMSAAMVPAAADCIVAHFEDNSIDESYYDFIITGDLTSYGGELLCSLLEQNNIKIKSKHLDCGALIFDTKNQHVYSGGSGCACFSTVFSGYFYKLLCKKTIKRVLCIPTGALLSPTSSQQGESIPGVAHAFRAEVE